MRKERSLIVFAVFVALFCAATAARAAWMENGIAVCMTYADITETSIHADGTGGAVIVWVDQRNGSADIYAQRIDAHGNALWTANGEPICTAASLQESPVVVVNGVTGESFFAWRDYRSSDYNIYAQKVDANGNALWESGGTAVCTVAGTQTYPGIVLDGAGGAIITWRDNRADGNDIYAQRITSDGKAGWEPATGVPVCTAAGWQYYPAVVSDGTGGAIVAWSDYRSTNWDIYAQRLNRYGSIMWTANGVPVCAASLDQYYFSLCGDGAGGMIAAWTDGRSGNDDVYAQRMSANGTAMWPANGRALCTHPSGQGSVVIAEDGSGGAVVAWADNRATHYEIYAQRVNADGVPMWLYNGVAICTEINDQHDPKIASFGAAGAVISWVDERNGSYDLYAQKVDGVGAVQWTANGEPVSTGYCGVGEAGLAAVDETHAILAWTDCRSGSRYDLYAQRIGPEGIWGYPEPEIHSILDVPGDEGGFVNLAWNGGELDPLGDISYFTIWRALSTPAALLLMDRGAAVVSSGEEIPAEIVAPVIRVERLGALTYYWELIASLDSYRLSNYSKIVATAFDSTAVCGDYHYFQVIAHTYSPLLFFASVPDSGYSVDNLAPCPLLYLAGEQIYEPAGLDLTWNRSTAADLAGYRIYRGLAADFAPSEENLLGAPCDTVFFDATWDWSAGYWYKAAAVDIHGNESAYAVLGPDGVTGDETPRAPEASYLSQNFPNPFNPVTRIVFGLSAPGHVSLRIYDAAGRFVRELVNETRAAARYEEVWDGKNGARQMVSSGMYFYRLEAGSFTQTKKMILLQ